MTRTHPEKPSVGRSTEPLPDIEKVEQWLQKLGEMGDPMGQVASLERLERQLRRARVAELAGRGEFPGLSALQRFVRHEKKKAEEWKEQHVARKTRGEIDLRYRAFTAPSGSKELQDHLWEIQQHNEVLRTKAENYFLLRHNADRVARKLGAGRVDELAHAFESSMEVCQQQVLDLIEAYTCGLGDLEEQGKYLKRMLRWYEEADYISRPRYSELRPFKKVVESLLMPSTAVQQEVASKASNKDEQDNSDCPGSEAKLSKEEAHCARTVVSVLKKKGKEKFSTYAKLNRRLERDDLNRNSDDMPVQGATVTKGAKRAARRLTDCEIRGASHCWNVLLEADEQGLIPEK